mmetsp:Transcript_10774/g.26687  ORF Transcript_10774/g.26687 Transcript_10774/m.26687 type:complete len:214 (-) Transcript_10774:402-1043(-)
MRPSHRVYAACQARPISHLQDLGGRSECLRGGRHPHSGGSLDRWSRVHLRTRRRWGYEPQKPQEERRCQGWGRHRPRQTPRRWHLLGSAQETVTEPREVPGNGRVDDQAEHCGGAARGDGVCACNDGCHGLRPRRPLTRDSQGQQHQLMHRMVQGAFGGGGFGACAKGVCDGSLRKEPLELRRGPRVCGRRGSRGDQGADERSPDERGAACHL